MPIFYRGAGLDTYWHTHDARIQGFVAQYPGAGLSLNRILHHIARGTTASAVISLTRSFGIAVAYALAGKRLPNAIRPAYVYEVEIEENDRHGTRLIDPVVEIAKSLGSPYDARSYHHDGDSTFLLGIADPVRHETELNQPVKHPPPGTGVRRTPLLHIELEALVRALRDSEILAFGAVAAAQIRRRIDVC
jgi:hypothetical protein